MNLVELTVDCHHWVEDDFPSPSQTGEFSLLVCFNIETLPFASVNLILMTAKYLV